jgi:uncharacterized membrane protein YphA (DoxX/SURF4 family)
MVCGGTGPLAQPGPIHQMTEITDKRIIRLGRLFYGLGIAALGAQCFYNADFVPVILPSFPSGIPGHSFWNCVAGAGLIITGVAIVAGKGVRAAALLLGAGLLAALVLRDIPFQASTNYSPIASWNNCFKALTLAGGAFAVAASAPGPGSATWDRRFVSFGCFAIAVTVAVFGVEHFMYAAFVADLVPSWIPGHLFWTYFCGSALVAAGAGMILRVKARLAAGLLGLMIFVWLLILHIPRAFADPHGDQGNECTSVFEALAFTGIAFIVAQLLPSRGPTKSKN